MVFIFAREGGLFSFIKIKPLTYPRRARIVLQKREHMFQFSGDYVIMSQTTWTVVRMKRKEIVDRLVVILSSCNPDQLECVRKHFFERGIVGTKVNSSGFFLN